MAYGLAWALIGLRMMVRGSATFHHGPPSGQTPEVAAA